MNLGENIYRLRTEKNLSQGDLADALEVSRQSVSKWENNSAVPELEKLIKMAQIFGVTIDELVSGEAKEQTAATPAPLPSQERIIYVEKPVPTGISGWKILGAILTIGAFLLAIFLSTYEYTFSLGEVVLLALPLGICGIICLVSKHPPLGLFWTVCIGYWIYLFVISLRWETMTGLILLGVILVASALVYTISLDRRGTIHVQPWLWAVLTLVLAGAALLLMVNLIPPFEGVATPVKPSSFE